MTQPAETIERRPPTVCETCCGSGTIEEDRYVGGRHITVTVPCPTCEDGMERQADAENAAAHDAGWRNE